MTETTLLNVLYAHLETLGLPCDLQIKLGGYSKCYYGRYDTVNEVVTLYHLDEEGSLIELDYLLSTLRHEAIHHFQWKHDKSFKRVKGIMHNLEFYRLEKFYTYKYLLKKGDNQWVS